MPSPGLDRYWELVPQHDSPLYEVATLGLEAELWPRAARDARWDPWLSKTVSERSVRLFCEGRLDEAAATARRALRISPTPEVRVGQTFAFSTLLEISTLRGADPGRLEARIGAWSEGLPEGPIKGWMLWERALRLAEVGKPDEGIDLTQQLVELSSGLTYKDDEHYEASMLDALTEVELRAGRADRAEALVNRREAVQKDSVPLWRVRISHLRGEAADEALVARATWAQLWNGDHWYARQKVAKIRREQARLGRRR